MRDPYEALGVTELASDDEIREAYRRLTRQWHPDRYVTARPDEQAEAAERFAEVTGAYRLLQDPAALARWRGHQRRSAPRDSSAGSSRPAAADTPPPRHEPPRADPPPPRASGPFDYRDAAASEFYRRPTAAGRAPSYGYTARGGTPRRPPPAPAKQRPGTPPPRPPWDGVKLLASAFLVVVIVPLVTIGLIKAAQSPGGDPAVPAALPHAFGGPSGVPASSLSTGDCFDTSVTEGEDENTVWSVRVLSCSVPHESEMIGRLDVGDGLGSPCPGREVIVAHAQPTCRSAYPVAVGAAFGPDMPLGLEFIFPSRASWADGDRLVVCAVTSHDGAPLVGTAREIVWQP